MDLVLIFLHWVKCMRVSIKMVKWMGLVFILSKMAINIRDIGKMISGMDKDHSPI